MKYRKVARSIGLATMDLLKTPYDIVAAPFTGSFLNTCPFVSRKVAAESRMHRMRYGLAIHSYLLPYCLYHENVQATALNAIALLSIAITNHWTKKRMQELLFLKSRRERGS
jgi:hypothetical protein